LKCKLSKGLPFPPNVSLDSERYGRRDHTSARKKRPSQVAGSVQIFVTSSKISIDRVRARRPSSSAVPSEGCVQSAKKKVTRAASEEVRALDSGTRGVKVGSRTVAFGHVMHETWNL